MKKKDITNDDYNWIIRRLLSAGFTDDQTDAIWEIIEIIIYPLVECDREKFTKEELKKYENPKVKDIK